MATTGVVLLDFWASMFGMRCRIALAEKRVVYEYVEQDLVEKSELLLTSNPVHKKIPVLLHDSKPVCESSVIMQYVDEVWPGDAPLLPIDPYARAQARFWVDYIDRKMHECTLRLWQLKKEAREESKKEFIEILKVLEGELDGKQFFGGETFGFVDVALVPYTAWFYAYEQCANFSTEKECSELAAWRKRCMERESVAKTLPDPKKIYDFVVYIKKKFGLE